MTSGKIIFLKTIMLMKVLCVSSPENIGIEHRKFPRVWRVCRIGSTSQRFTSIPEVKQTLRNSIHFTLHDFLLYHNAYQFNAIFLSLQNERSDTFHRQQESRDSRKPLSCLPSVPSTVTGAPLTLSAGKIRATAEM